MRLAIVGSQDKWWPVGKYDEVLELIWQELEWVQPDEVVSGGASGVDTWAVEVAEEMLIPTRVCLPSGRHWEFYKERNMEIANTSDWLLCIRSSTAGSYGSAWTADYAERIGRIVKRVVV